MKNIVWGIQRPFHFELNTKSCTGGASSGVDFVGIENHKFLNYLIVCSRFLLKELHRRRK